MSSLLNFSYDASRKPEEFSLKDTEVFVDSEEQNWFKRDHVVKFLVIEDIQTSLNGLEKCEILTRQELVTTRRGTPVWPGPKDQENKTDKFLSFFGVMYVIVNSQKDKGKVLRKHVLKDIVPRGFDARVEEIQKKLQQAIEEKHAAIALLNDDLKNQEYENVGLQGEIRAKDQQIVALQRRYVGYLSDEDKNNGISIIAKNNEEAEYSYISICGKHGYRRHKVRVLLTRTKGSTLLADGDTPNAIVTHNFWREHRLIVVDPGRPKHFRLYMVNQEQLLALNDT